MNQALEVILKGFQDLHGKVCLDFWIFIFCYWSSGGLCDVSVNSSRGMCVSLNLSLTQQMEPHFLKGDLAEKDKG